MVFNRMAGFTAATPGVRYALAKAVESACHPHVLRRRSIRRLFLKQSQPLTGGNDCIRRPRRAPNTDQATYADTLLMTPIVSLATLLINESRLNEPLTLD